MSWLEYQPAFFFFYTSKTIPIKPVHPDIRAFGHFHLWKIIFFHYGGWWVWRYFTLQTLRSNISSVSFCFPPNIQCTVALHSTVSPGRMVLLVFTTICGVDSCCLFYLSSFLLCLTWMLQPICPFFSYGELLITHANQIQFSMLGEWKSSSRKAGIRMDHLCLLCTWGSVYLHGLVLTLQFQIMKWISCISFSYYDVATLFIWTKCTYKKYQKVPKAAWNRHSTHQKP